MISSTADFLGCFSFSLTFGRFITSFRALLRFLDFSSPDFLLPDFDVYLEPKGYWWGDDKRKMEIIFETYPNVKIILIEKDLYQSLISKTTKEDFLRELGVIG